jgi:hypothetical protein
MPPVSDLRRSPPQPTDADLLVALLDAKHDDRVHSLRAALRKRLGVRFHDELLEDALALWTVELLHRLSRRRSGLSVERWLRMVWTRSLAEAVRQTEARFSAPLRLPRRASRAGADALCGPLRDEDVQGEVPAPALRAAREALLRRPDALGVAERLLAPIGKVPTAAARARAERERARDRRWLQRLVDGLAG